MKDPDLWIRYEPPPPDSLLHARFLGIIEDTSLDPEEALVVLREGLLGTNAMNVRSPISPVPMPAFNPNATAFWVCGGMAQPLEWNAKEHPGQAKALELLRAHLTVEQRLQLLKDKTFTAISSSGTPYVVSELGVERLDHKGKLVESFCLTWDRPDLHGDPTLQNFDPAASCPPPADLMLARKLMLEADEQEFLELANRTRHEETQPRFPEVLKGLIQTWPRRDLPALEAVLKRVIVDLRRRGHFIRFSALGQTAITATNAAYQEAA